MCACVSQDLTPQGLAWVESLLRSEDLRESKEEESLCMSYGRGEFHSQDDNDEDDGSKG